MDVGSGQLRSHPDPPVGPPSDLLPPERPHDGDPLLDDPGSDARRAAVIGELLPVPPPTNPEHQPAAAQPVEAGDGMRELDGIVFTDQRHTGADLERCRRSHERQRDLRVQKRA